MNEVQSLLPETIELLSLADIGCTEDIPETQDTIEGNAIQKAEYVKTKYGYNCFADDTGLEVFSLNGDPGVYSARYAGSQRNPEDNMNKLLEKLKNHDNRAAQFKTVIALHLNNKLEIFEGICKGEIIQTKRGEKGFGYDPLFKPYGYDKTFAELSLEEKNGISHRGKAVQRLVTFLKLI